MGRDAKGTRLVTNLRDYLQPLDIVLSVQGTTRSAILSELVARLGLPADSSSNLLKILEHREAVGSTGVGHGMAIPHCRTPLVPRLRVVFGRKADGVDWGAVDAGSVTRIFLLVAPPIEVANDYLPALGRIAQLMKQSAFRQRLDLATTPEDVLKLFDEPGV